MIPETVAVKYGPIAVGLVAGSAAKFGRQLALGQSITWRHIVGHILMMGLVGAFAVYVTDLVGITNNDARVFFAAVLAVAAADVIQWLATRAWLRLINDGIVLEQQLRGEIRQTEQVIESSERLASRTKDEGKSQ